MATAKENTQDRIDEFRDYIDEVLNADVDLGSILPEIHNEFLKLLALAQEIHLNDQEMHGASALPAGAEGSLLKYIEGAGWNALAAGLKEQGLVLDDDAKPIWQNLIPNINLAFEADGYCYTGVDDTPQLYLAAKNLKLYVPQSNKHILLHYNDASEYQINLKVNTTGGFTKAYLVITKTNLLAATLGSALNITKVDELTADHLVLLETKSGAGTTMSFASGLLQNLASEYRSLNFAYDEIPVVAGYANIPVGKNDKLLQRSYINSNVNFVLTTPFDFLFTEGKVIIKNTAAITISVSFSGAFSASVFSIPAGKEKVYHYFRKTEASTKLSVIDLTEVPDLNDKGWFANEAAIIAAYPAGQDGWHAINGETDTAWVWDGDTTAWIDTGKKGINGRIIRPINLNDPASNQVDVTDFDQFTKTCAADQQFEIVNEVLTDFKLILTGGNLNEDLFTHATKNVTTVFEGGNVNQYDQLLTNRVYCILEEADDTDIKITCVISNANNAGYYGEFRNKALATSIIDLEAAEQFTKTCAADQQFEIQNEMNKFFKLILTGGTLHATLFTHATKTVQIFWENGALADYIPGESNKIYATIESITGAYIYIAASIVNSTNRADFIPTDQKGVANGVAPLGADTKISSVYLPSYVDDVLEYADFASLPAAGETGKIYVTLDDNLQYRWSGSVYVEVSKSLALGETSTSAHRGDHGKAAYDHSVAAHAPSNAQKNSDITKAEIEDKLTGTVTTHDHKEAFAALTTGAAVAWDASTGQKKTLSRGGDFTLTFSNLFNGFEGRLRLDITSTTTITLAGTGVTIKKLGSFASLTAGVYWLTCEAISSTVLECNISLYE